MLAEHLLRVGRSSPTTVRLSTRKVANITTPTASMAEVHMASYATVMLRRILLGCGVTTMFAQVELTQATVMGRNIGSKIEQERGIPRMKIFITDHQPSRRTSTSIWRRLTEPLCIA